ncbi:MAG: DUF484 family protein [Rhodospirillales bacterium]|nr:DUF484 family protein [Rhodospirillales bacterium]
MTGPAARAPAEAAPEAAEIAAWLRAHPGFLAENPALYAALAPPRRVHGEVLSDHMAAMLARAREEAARMAAHAGDVLAAGRAASGLAARVQEAVLALIAAPDPAECIAHALPGLLGLDAAALCVEADLPRMRPLPVGTVARLLDGRAARIGAPPADAALLHGEAARLAAWDAIALVPWHGPPALLALAGREGMRVGPDQGAPASILGALGFLGRAAGAALERGA